MIEFETANRSEAEVDNAAALKAQADAGVQPLHLSAAETDKWRTSAVEAAWKAVIERNPESVRSSASSCPGRERPDGP